MSKVLIIDDSAAMRKIIQRGIQQSGLLVDEFVEARNGREGLEKAIINNIDLILCDWNMPKMTGYMTGVDFVEALRGSDIPIVMVIDKGSEAEVKNSGANGYLTKPFTPNQLRLKLRNFLKGK